MAQAGFLGALNAWPGNEQTLDETNDVLKTGGSGNNLTASIDGANLSVGQAMTDITFQYNASGSGNGT
ncbi:MAG: hypothetical protein CXT69_03715, partial [Methanobacteriota archaeon]